MYKRNMIDTVKGMGAVALVWTAMLLWMQPGVVQAATTYFVRTPDDKGVVFGTDSDYLIEYDSGTALLEVRKSGGEGEGEGELLITTDNTDLTMYVDFKIPTNAAYFGGGYTAGVGSTGATINAAGSYWTDGSIITDSTMYASGAITSLSDMSSVNGVFSGTVSVGGGYGVTGASISTAGVITANGAITTDDALTALSAVIGGGYGATGATISSAGVVQADGAITTAAGLTALSGAFGGGYGSTGLTISEAGVLQANGAMTTDGALTAASAAIGGGYGSTGISLSDAGVIQADGAITSAAGLTGLSAAIGGGYGSTGVTISEAGVVQSNGAITSDGIVTATGGVRVGDSTSIGCASDPDLVTWGTNLLTIAGQATANTVVIGGGYGDSGITISSAGVVQADGAIATAGAITAASAAIGDGYGSTGLDVTSAGHINTDGHLRCGSWFGATAVDITDLPPTGVNGLWCIYNHLSSESQFLSGDYNGGVPNYRPLRLYGSAITLGAATSHDTTVAGKLSVDNGEINSNDATFALLDSTVTTLTVGQSATSVTVGAETGTLSLRNPTVAAGAALTAGTADTTAGSLVLYGGSADYGGSLRIENGANYDTTTECWEFEPSGEDLRLTGDPDGTPVSVYDIDGTTYATTMYYPITFAGSNVDRFTRRCIGDTLAMDTADALRLLVAWITPATILDYSTYRHTMVPQNLTAVDSLVKGDAWSIDLDGSTEYAYSADANEFSFGDASNDSAFSVLAWVEVVDTANAQMILAKYTTSADREWGLQLSTTEAAQLVCRDESIGVSTTRTADAGMSAGWHCVCSTYDGTGGATALDGTNAAIYVDGVVVASTAVNQATYVAMENLTGVLTIGRQGTTTGWFAGDMGLVSLWGEELTAAKVWKLYCITRGYYGV